MKSASVDKTTLMEAVIPRECYLKFIESQRGEPSADPINTAGGDCTMSDLPEADQFQPKFRCELQDPESPEKSSNGILVKLLQIIKNDRACIIENRDVFT